MAVTRSRYQHRSRTNANCQRRPDRQWQGPRVRDYCREVSSKLIDCARSAGYEVPVDGEHAAHIFGMRPPAGTDVDTLRQTLQSEHVYVSVRGDAIRVSPHVYNDDLDVRRFAQALQARI